MVLDDVVGQPDSFPSEPAPTGDYDPYSSTNDSQSTPHTPPGYVLDLNKLPSPPPIIGPLFGYSSERLRNQTYRSFASFAAIVRRPLTSDECDSIAYHVHKAGAIASWGQPLGVIAGYYRYHTTRSTFRFPFYKPGKELNREKLLFLQGAQARFAWDFLRLGAYGLVGGWLGKVIVGTYAATTAAVGQHADPRMKAILETVRVSGNAEASRRARSTPEWDRARGGQRGGNVPDGAPVEDYGGVMAEEGGQGDGATSNSRKPAAPTRPAWTPQNTQTVDSRDSFDWDDASPTAGNPPLETGSASGAGSGSVWEQLRRGGTSPSSQRTPPSQRGQPEDNAWARMRGNNAEQSGNASSNDSFASPSTQEDRDSARQKAQEEFDARIDRERHGEKFDDPKRWS